jgi:hypothetical protein
MSSRRGFLKGLAAMVAAASVEVCGLRADITALAEPLKQRIRFAAYETIGVTFANTRAVQRIDFIT